MHPRDHRSEQQQGIDRRLRIEHSLIIHRSTSYRACIKKQTALRILQTFTMSQQGGQGTAVSADIVDVKAQITTVSTVWTPDSCVDVDPVCREIKKVVLAKKWGCDASCLIESLGSTSPMDRHKIALHYPLVDEKPLKAVMKQKTSGDFGTVMKYLSLSPAEAECAMIKDACKGVRYHHAVLYSILCGRSNEDMRSLKNVCRRVYSKDLIEIVGSGTSDAMKLLAASIRSLEESFDPQIHTEKKVKDDVSELMKRNQGKFLENSESIVFKLVFRSSTKYLKVFNNKYGYHLYKVLEEELSGNALKGILFALRMKVAPFEAIAELIKSAACPENGVDKFLLLTCCIIRYQDVMPSVNTEHFNLYGISIHNRIRSKCRGNYRDVLLALLNKSCPED